MERMLSGHGRRLIDAAGLRTGDDVLDVGCGTGTSSCEAARRVRPGGSVTAVDISAPLLAVAEEAGRDLPIHFVLGDAASHPLPIAAFDVLISQFGLQLFPHPASAFAHLAAAVRPGGRLVFVTWRDGRANVWSAIPAAAVAAHLGGAPGSLGPPPEAEGEPGPFSLADPGRVRRLLEGAGFEGIAMEAVDDPVWVATDLDDALRFFEASAPDLVASLPPAVMDRVRSTLRAELAPHAEPDGIRLPAAAWIVTARRAGPTAL